MSNIATAPTSRSHMAGGAGANPRRMDTTVSLASTLRFELVKMLSPWRIRLFLLVCLLAPALFIGVVGLQSTLPTDTVFGRWMAQSGWAGSLVVLAFSCNWVLPLLTSLVAGDAFAMEDRLGTWRHMMTAVRSPQRIFAAKAIASVLVVELMVACLALSSILGGALLAGTHPLVGLHGQQLGAVPAIQTALLAWLSVAVATLAWAGVGLLGSVLFGRSPMGLLLPAVVALVLQLCQMLPLPVALRLALPSQAFVAWRGLFTDPVQTRALVIGVVVSLVWAAVTTVLARHHFVRRDFTDLAHDGAPRRVVLAGLLPLLLVGAVVTAVLAPFLHPQGHGITRAGLERAMADTFANLYVLQTQQMDRPALTFEQVEAHASCDRGGTAVEDEGAGTDWRCVVDYRNPGSTTTGQAIYQVDVAPDGRIVADGDGPVAVNGYFIVQTPSGPAANPLWQFDSLVDLLDEQ